MKIFRVNPIFFFAILIATNSSAQLQADFHCTGSGFDGGCGGFADISNPFASIIVNWFWDFGNGMTSNLQNPQSICYDSIGSYTVCLTVFDANGFSSQKCKQNYMSRDSIGVHCNYFIGISDIARAGFDLYPNPVNDNLTISMNDFQETEVFLYDITARKIMCENFFHTITLNVNNLPKGIYFFQLTNKDNYTYNGKFLKG